MRSSRNRGHGSSCNAASCNRLENAVKPQPYLQREKRANSCNRLENAVKPQHHRTGCIWSFSCNRLENAVKPQQDEPDRRFEPVVTD